MRFLVDQNLAPVVDEGLVAAGHDAVHTETLGLARADDEVVLQRAQADDRVVVSADTDFGDLLVLPEATSRQEREKEFGSRVAEDYQAIRQLPRSTAVSP